jgi:predicted phosphoadenosine phosphosulfate sulfurtransferase
MWVKGFNIQEMRVSNLIHERAFKSLATLQEFEPDTYDRLQRRLKGVHTAALYAKEQTVYATDKRPANFKTWLAYRDFLLETLPNGNQQTFLSRFASQKQNETVYRQQCRQLLLNDWENNIPVIQLDQRANPLEKWKDLL